MLPQPERDIKEAIEATRKAIIYIRLMIWAGDYEDAQDVIEDTVFAFSSKLAAAIELRKKVSKLERDIRGEVTDDEEILEIDKVELMDSASKQSSKIIGEETNLYSLGVLANILFKLDERIAKQLGKKSKMSNILARKPKKTDFQQFTLDREVEKESNQILGFSYVWLILDDNKVEYRAYRLEEPTLPLVVIERNLFELKGMDIRKWDNAIDVNDRPMLPYRYIGFQKDFQVEITVFDLHRVKVYISSNSDIAPLSIFKRVLEAFI
jgi:hypothetical protein